MTGRRGGGRWSSAKTGPDPDFTDEGEIAIPRVGSEDSRLVVASIGSQEENASKETLDTGF